MRAVGSVGYKHVEKPSALMEVERDLLHNIVTRKRSPTNVLVSGLFCPTVQRGSYRLLSGRGGGRKRHGFSGAV